VEDENMTLNFTYYKPQFLIPLIGIFWSISSWGLSKIWGYGLLQGFGPTTLITAFLLIYDKLLWKLPVFNIANSVPNLNGNYTGKIDFYWGGRNSLKSCEMLIKQTCSNIKVITIFSKEGENDTQSTSTEAFIKTDEAGDQYIYFYYHNRGSCKDGDTLNQHDGMNVLEIIKDKENILLKGYYFTNRDPQTKGCMEVIKI